MVPGAGLEPARSYKRGILNPLCLPIPPPGHCYLYDEKLKDKGSFFYSRTLVTYLLSLERLTRLELVTFTLAT